MTFTLTLEHLYISIIVVLSILQITQWVYIRKLINECNSLWEQMQILAIGLSNQIGIIQKDLNSKQDKK